MTTGNRRAAIGKETAGILVSQNPCELSKHLVDYRLSLTTRPRAKAQTIKIRLKLLSRTSCKNKKPVVEFLSVGNDMASHESADHLQGNISVESAVNR